MTPALQRKFSNSDLNVTSLHIPFCQIKLCAHAMQDGEEDKKKKKHNNKTKTQTERQCLVPKCF